MQNQNRLIDFATRRNDHDRRMSVEALGRQIRAVKGLIVSRCLAHFESFPEKMPGQVQIVGLVGLVSGRAAPR